MPPETLTVTAVAVGSPVTVLPSEAVTVMSVAAAPSSTVLGLSESVTAIGAMSLSVMVRVAEPEVRPVAAPVRTTVSSPSTRISSVGSNERVAVPLVAFAGIVTVKSLIAG